MTFRTGDRVLVTAPALNGAKVLASIKLASPNGKSLMLQLEDAGLPTTTGGLYLDMVPVLLGDDDVYRDLVSADAITIEPTKLHAP